MKHTLTYSKPLKMKDVKVYQAIIVNYFIGTMAECLSQEKIEIENGFKTEIK